MAERVCRFCGIRIPLDKSVLASGAIVCLGTNVAHRACVFDESQDRQTGSWQLLTVEDIANFSRAPM